MSLILDMVVQKVRAASLQELTEFAKALSRQLSESQLTVIERLVAQEKERRVISLGPHKHTRWGI